MGGAEHWKRTRNLGHVASTGRCRPAEEEAGAGRGLRVGRTWPAAALPAGGGAAPGRGTCGRAAAAASASLLWPARNPAVPSPSSSPTSLPALFPLSPRFSPPHPELQDGGARDGSREPRAGQVTRVAGGGAGRYSGPAHRRPGALGLGGREEGVAPVLGGFGSRSLSPEACILSSQWSPGPRSRCVFPRRPSLLWASFITPSPP